MEAGERPAAAQQQLDDALYASAETLRIAVALLHPVLPESTANIWAQLGMTQPHRNAGNRANSTGASCRPEQKIGMIAPVFPRIEAKSRHRPHARARRRRNRPASEAAGQVSCTAARTRRQSLPPSPKIDIDDFVKVDLRVGQVLSAEPVKGADKLLHLKVDIGEPEPRTIVAGIAKAYEAGETDRSQGGDRRQPASAQTAWNRIERHDRGGIARRRRAGARGLPRRRPGGRTPEVNDVHRFPLPPRRRTFRRRSRRRARPRRRGRRHAHAVDRHRRGPESTAPCVWPIRTSRSYASVGVHPHDASKADCANLDDLRALAANPKVVAFGEIGLDYHYDFSPRETSAKFSSIS